MTPLMHACRELMIYPSEAGADVIFGVKADLKSSQTSVNVKARNVHDSHSSQMVNLGDVFHDLARQKKSRVLKGICNPIMCTC
jgi:hypothetical protein